MKAAIGLSDQMEQILRQGQNDLYADKDDDDQLEARGLLMVEFIAQDLE